MCWGIQDIPAFVIPGKKGPESGSFKYLPGKCKVSITAQLPLCADIILPILPVKILRMKRSRRGISGSDSIQVKPQVLNLTLMQQDPDHPTLWGSQYGNFFQPPPFFSYWLFVPHLVVITPGRGQGSIWGFWDWAWIWHMQGKCFIHQIIAQSP